MSHTFAKRCTVCGEFEDLMCPECKIPSSYVHGTADSNPWSRWHADCMPKDA